MQFCVWPDLRIERVSPKCARRLAAKPRQFDADPCTNMPKPFKPFLLLMSKFQKRQTHSSGHAAQHRAVIAISQRHMVFEP